MSTTLLLVIGALAILAIVWAVFKMVKVAVVFGLVAAIIYIVAQYALPFWETHLAPYVALAGSYF